MKYIDISQRLGDSSPVYPGDESTSIYTEYSIDKNGNNSYIIKSSLHTSTHVDVPLHMIKDSKYVSEYKLDNFIGKGVLLDVRNQELIDYKDKYLSIITEGDIVLFMTNYDKHLREEKYLTNHPVISEKLANFLVERKVKMIGVDMPSPDKHPYSVHKTLLSNNIFILENLANLEQLIDIKKFTVYAVPLKIDADASCVRAICMID